MCLDINALHMFTIRELRGHSAEMYGFGERYRAESVDCSASHGQRLEGRECLVYSNETMRANVRPLKLNAPEALLLLAADHFKLRERS